MLCLSKLRGKDAYCQKHALTGRKRCSLHGGLSPSGFMHWNFQGKGCTKEERKRAVETNAHIKFLELVAIELGMIEKKR